MLHLQKIAISFTLTDILSFETKIIETKKKYVKIKASEKWNYFE